MKVTSTLHIFVALMEAMSSTAEVSYRYNETGKPVVKYIRSLQAAKFVAKTGTRSWHTKGSREGNKVPDGSGDVLLPRG